MYKFFMRRLYSGSVPVSQGTYRNRIKSASSRRRLIAAVTYEKKRHRPSAFGEARFFFDDLVSRLGRGFFQFHLVAPEEKGAAPVKKPFEPLFGHGGKKTAREK